MKVVCKTVPKPMHISWCDVPVQVVRTLIKDNPGVSKRNLLALAQAAGVAFHTAYREINK
jgi:hypothetical protein